MAGKQPSSVLLRAGMMSMLLVLGAGSQALTAEADFFRESFGDLREELAAAREEGKHGVFVFFEMDECPFCFRMKQTILNQADIIDWFKQRFVSISVDIEGDTELTNFDGEVMKAKDFALKLHRVRATPVLAFFDLQGKRVARVTGAVNSKQEFMLLGEYVLGKHYETTNFSRYKRAQRAKGADH